MKSDARAFIAISRDNPGGNIVAGTYLISFQERELRISSILLIPSHVSRMIFRGGILMPHLSKSGLAKDFGPPLGGLFIHPSSVCGFGS